MVKSKNLKKSETKTINNNNSSKKDVGSLSQRLQRILLYIHWYSIRILYKPSPQLFLVNWLSRYNHKTNRGQEILGLNISINAIQSCVDIPDCITSKEIRPEIIDDEHLSML